MKERINITLKVKFKSRIVLLILVVLLYCTAYSQFSFYKNYTSNDGLPSSKIYDMLQDKNGYMWFATENGVSRFDGYEFRNFTTRDGLPANSTIRIYEDYKGRIWFCSYQGPLSYFENGEIIKFALNDDLMKVETAQFFENIYIDSLETIWLSPYKQGLYKILSNNEIRREYIKDNITASNFFTLFYFFDNNELMVWVQVKNKEIIHSEELVSKGIHTVEFATKGTLPYYQNYHCRLDENLYLFSVGTDLKTVFKDEVIFEKSFNNEILSIYKDNSQNIWLSEQFNGIFMYPKGDLNKKPIEYLSNLSISKVLQDNEGNYWFSTTKNGIYFVPSIEFKNYTKDALKIDNNIIVTLETHNNQLFYTTDNKGIHSAYLENSNIRINPTFKIDGFKISNIQDLLITSEKYLWVSDSEYLIYHLNGVRAFDYPHKAIVGYNFLHHTDNSIWLSHKSGFNKYENFKLCYESENHSFDKQVFSLFEQQDSTVLLGTVEGLYKLKNDKYSKYDSTCTVLNSRISDIKSSDGNLWIGTFNNGIVVCSNSTCYYINQNNGLNSNRIKVFFIEDKYNIWVGTNKGISHITLSDLADSAYNIENYTIWDGLPSNEINDIIKHNNLIWLATDKGLASFNPREITKSIIPPILNLENVLVNENEINIAQDSLVLNSTNNNITFHYAAISFKDPGNITYYYKLKGLDDHWLKTRNTSIRYPDLNYGEYTFELKAQNTNGTLSEPITYNFSIDKHFTQTIFFIIFIIIWALAFLSILFFYFLRTFKRREELKHQVLLSEQVALRAQMNPHFIFNALNSIQDFVLRRDDKNANFFLSNFSTLMRKILETSKNNTISLQEEIETLRIYLDLEKLRFEGLFKYNINIDKSINPSEIFIPTLLLQTYIENAIWHGLVPKNAEGLLDLDFMLIRDNKLLISISDNGIGRKKAGEISRNRKHHRSMGMKKTSERIKLINKLNKTNIAVEVIDLYNEENIAAGTRIEIIFDV